MPTLAVVQRILADAILCDGLILQPVAEAGAREVATPILNASSDDSDENILITQMNTETDQACLAFNAGQANTIKTHTQAYAEAKAAYDAATEAADKAAGDAQRADANACNAAVAASRQKCRDGLLLLVSKDAAALVQPAPPAAPAPAAPSPAVPAAASPTG